MNATENDRKADESPDDISIPSDASPRTLKSDELFQGQKEVHIAHQGELYRLRLTRNGRLVLYK